MKVIHSKSPCCQERTYRYGGKRRKCAQCGKTWTARPKKRGRKRIRRFKSPVLEILSQGMTLTFWAERHNITLPNASQQFHRLLTKFISKPVSHISTPGPYVLLADGFWFTFKKQDWVVFLLALKPISKQQAYFLDPVLLPGGESYENWTSALGTIPPKLKKQVKAMVSDGFRASGTICWEQAWIHQRCHFHLIAYLQVRRGRRKKGLSGASIREAIYQTVLRLLKEREEQKVKALILKLRLLARKLSCPKSMRMIVSEFLRTLPDFRAYLNYPELHLPSTTGSVETMGKLLRKRVNPVRTAKALKPWATALIRLKSPITCNGKELST